MTSQAFAKVVSAYNEQERVRRSQLAHRPTAMIDKVAGLWPKGVMAEIPDFDLKALGVIGTVPEVPDLNALGVIGTVPEVPDLNALGVIGSMPEFPKLDPKALGVIAAAPDMDWLATAADAMRDMSHLGIPDVDLEAATRAFDAHFGQGPVVVRDRREPLPVEVDLPPVGAKPKPSDLAEISSRAEARKNLEATEDLLRDAGLIDELEHLEAISVSLSTGTKSGRVHAAMSASIVFKGVADAAFPGRKGPWVDRWKQTYGVEKKDTRNRLATFIDAHLRAELTTHEHRRLQGLLDFAHRWSAEGHHVPYSAELANRAYRDLLAVLAYAGRARRSSR